MSLSNKPNVRTSSSSSGETLRGDETESPKSSEIYGEYEESGSEKPESTSAHEKETISRLNDEEVQRDGSKLIIKLPLSDPEHPENWSKWKKAIVLAGGIVTIIHSTLGSSLPSNAIEYIAQTYHVTNEIQLVLPISTFLMGFVFAPTACGPLSENFGRKPVMMISFILFILFTMACAVSPTWASFLFFRFLCGLSAAAPIACVSGIFADINGDPRARGRSMAVFMVCTVCGPIIAPPLSGFIAENTSWRWVFGVGTLFQVATLPFVLLMPETYAPILLSKRAARLRKETGNQNIIAESDLQRKTFRYVMTTVMTRPFRMLFRELIVSTTCVYLALCYGIFYLYFEAYPIIFQGPNSVYKFSPGIAGLMFLPICVGAFVAGAIFMCWDYFLARAQARNAKWSQKEEFRRLPLAFAGGPLYAISIIWLGWSSREGVFWLVPVLSGVAFGAGFILIYMAMLNYLSGKLVDWSCLKTLLTLFRRRVHDVFGISTRDCKHLPQFTWCSTATSSEDYVSEPRNRLGVYDFGHSGLGTGCSALSVCHVWRENQSKQQVLSGIASITAERRRREREDGGIRITGSIE